MKTIGLLELRQTLTQTLEGLDEPVTITKHQKPLAVVVPINQFEQMKFDCDTLRGERACKAAKAHATERRWPQG